MAPSVVVQAVLSESGFVQDMPQALRFDDSTGQVIVEAVLEPEPAKKRPKLNAAGLSTRFYGAGPPAQSPICGNSSASPDSFSTPTPNAPHVRNTFTNAHDTATDLQLEATARFSRTSAIQWAFQRYRCQSLLECLSCLLPVSLLRTGRTGWGVIKWHMKYIF